MFSLSWWYTWNKIQVWCPPPQSPPYPECIFSSFTKAKNSVGLKTSSIHSHYPSWYLKYMDKFLSSHHCEPSHRIKTLELKQTPYLAGNIMNYYYYCYFHIAYKKASRQWDPKFSRAVILTILLFAWDCKFPGIITWLPNAVQPGTTSCGLQGPAQSLIARLHIHFKWQ